VSNKSDPRAVTIKQLGEIFGKYFYGGRVIFDFLEDSTPLIQTRFLFFKA
jgi:hypothetical protein